MGSWGGGYNESQGVGLSELAEEREQKDCPNQKEMSRLGWDVSSVTSI